MRISVDTNILAYAEGVNEPEQQRAARRVLAGLEPSDVYVPVQVLGELFTVLTRKAKRQSADAARSISAWATIHPTLPTQEDDVMAASDLATRHAIALWDAVIVTVAAAAGCRVLLSEDMQHGFAWRGLTIVNPFAPAPHPLLAAALRRG